MPWPARQFIQALRPSWISAFSMHVFFHVKLFYILSRGLQDLELLALQIPTSVWLASENREWATLP